ncbi:hypothetical protein V6N11_080916 [Hibiscus sabdariffa]|uniref:Uncharacterized protein n=1 Tax=Hibiscus sabdariffa TaxID=183260 RepID=A0ABR2QIS9_9ROSI
MPRLSSSTYSLTTFEGHSTSDFAPVLCSSKSQLEFRGGRGIKDSDQSIMEGRRRCFGAKVVTLITSFN